LLSQSRAEASAGCSKSLWEAQLCQAELVQKHCMWTHLFFLTIVSNAECLILNLC
jgi:hypothetical protein